MNCTFSIIIPTFNRCELLELTLAALGLQTYPKSHFEVIVVDDGSGDDTQTFLRSATPAFSFRHASTHQNSGQGAARNLGAGLARNEILLFLDADILVLPDFLSEMNDELARDRKAIVSGTPYCFERIYTWYFPEFDRHQKENCQVVLDRSGLLPGALAQGEKKFPLLSKSQLKQGAGIIEQLRSPKPLVTEAQHREFLKGDVATWMSFNTGCISIHRDMFEQSGGFSETLRRGEDWELGYRISRSGVEIKLLGHPICFHQDHPHAREGASPGSSFSQDLLKRFPDDPELQLLSLWRDPDDLWRDMVLYKRVLRAMNGLETLEAGQLISLVRRAAKVGYKVEGTR